MARINQEEYEILKGLDDKWKWIARDKNGSLFAYLEKPPKDPYSRDWGLTGDEWFLIKEILFEFIQWEDKEPHNIAELIAEYEWATALRSVLYSESEEAEMKEAKTLEWAKNQIDLRDTGTTDTEDPQFYVNAGLKMALDFLDQIDEPETLSSDWIDENKVHMMKYNIGYYIPANKLYGKIMPKQEEVERLEEGKR